MSSYIGKHADLYDLFYAEKNYEQEVTFIHKWLQNYCKTTPRTILEIACGTGNHALLLTKYNYNIFATDYSEDLLQVARKKNKYVDGNVEFFLQDMSALPTPVTPYDAVICLFDSIGYVLSNERLNKVFQGVNKSLPNDGLFIFEFWHAAAMIKSYEPLRIKYYHSDFKIIQRISETTIDYASQICRVKYTIHEFDQTNNKYTQLEETQMNRFFLMQEMNNFICQNGFILLNAFDGYTDKTIIDNNSWHILAVCKKQISL